MKKRTKAVLLSAFVFPGLGHISVKKYIAGGILATCAAAALIFLVANSVQRALELGARLQSGQAQLDAGTISEVVSGQITGAEALLINVATLVLILCWLIGIIDSFRVGRAYEKERGQN